MNRFITSPDGDTIDQWTGEGIADERDSAPPRLIYIRANGLPPLDPQQVVMLAELFNASVVVRMGR